MNKLVKKVEKQLVKKVVGVVGATGYAGAELLRLLVSHPKIQIDIVTSRANHGQPVVDLYPNLRSHCDLTLVEPTIEALEACDIVFFATPHGIAQNLAPKLLSRSVKIIDISADFRLRDANLWAKWYGSTHTSPELLSQAVYGLPEINRHKILSANLVSCPGCYPTAILLGLIPLIKNNLVKVDQLIANAVSGLSGAGRQGRVESLFCEVSDSFKSYAVNGHRHLPEIEQCLKSLLSDSVVPFNLTFVPHLFPAIRGIHATLYSQLLQSDADLEKIYSDFYRNEPFVDVLPAGLAPQTRTVKGSNFCQLGIARPQQGNTVVVTSVIDNLIKGASGQAVQCMNIMCGFDETEGIGQLASLP